MVSSAAPHVPAMPQHLGGIAPPLRVLDIAAFFRIYLPCGYEALQFLWSADDHCGGVLAERHAFHHKEYVLQMNLCGIYPVAFHRLFHA